MASALSGNKILLGKRSNLHYNRTMMDFSKVGGLSQHIETLRDIIIFPLLYSDIYTHFKLKTPRGVLFYGPPGTGKTLVAGALAAEINKNSPIKVTFFEKRGADILDKWVGESEKKLRVLFEQATKNRPSVIFFDELDGLAPIRTQKNDHVHCSLVATLLALMDGLDAMPGVIVIGATNRIDAIDPALRRPGRFDKELYFPIPSTQSRTEILTVHTASWRPKLDQKLLERIAELTTGFCGSDLQALCAEAVLCCVKRLNPRLRNNFSRFCVKIKVHKINVEECDFVDAITDMIPSMQTLDPLQRKLGPIIRPLLQRIFEMVLEHIRTLWPHFFQQNFKYLIGRQRYIGKILLRGSNAQGLNNHLVPAILEQFEHLPVFDVPTLLKGNILGVRQNLPLILLMTQIDEFFSTNNASQESKVATILGNIDASLPILIIATCDGELPNSFANFFYNNSSIILKIENPTTSEIEQFLAPLFLADHNNNVESLQNVLTKFRNITERELRESTVRNGKTKKCTPCKRKSEDLNKIRNGRVAKRKTSDNNLLIKTNSVNNVNKLCNVCSVVTPSTSTRIGEGTDNNNLTIQKQFSTILSNLLKFSLNLLFNKSDKNASGECCQKNNSELYSYGETSDLEKLKIFNLWKRATNVTSKNMHVAHLEMLYDLITACIKIHQNNFNELIEVLTETLNQIERVNKN